MRYLSKCVLTGVFNHGTFFPEDAVRDQLIGVNFLRLFAGVPENAMLQ
ncbi:MAG TPA: hypothetical protein VGE12_08690 [Noviherbaspirillum sp.]